MTDKELLELAAKAAGIPLEFRVLAWSDGSEYPCYEDPDSVCVAPRYIPVITWNPLTDDGDALRLAVKLEMTVLADTRIDGSIAAQIDPPTPTLTSIWADELAETDPYAATRRAITRAAAEIGKAMK